MNGSCAEQERVPFQTNKEKQNKMTSTITALPFSDSNSVAAFIKTATAPEVMLAWSQIMLNPHPDDWVQVSIKSMIINRANQHVRLSGDDAYELFRHSGIPVMKSKRKKKVHFYMHGGFGALAIVIIFFALLYATVWLINRG